LIVNVPTAIDFTQAGSDLLNLAWSQVHEMISRLAEFDRDAAKADEEKEKSIFELPGQETPEEKESRHRAYWSAGERDLGNALTIAHQGIEFVLKGQVAAVSPYLLIVQDPKDWPKTDKDGNVDFGLFRTMDAIHLPRICEAVSGKQFPLDIKEEVRTFERIKKPHNTFRFQSSILTQRSSFQSFCAFTISPFQDLLGSKRDRPTLKKLAIQHFTHQIGSTFRLCERQLISWIA
jgi:hypothetical protein